MTFEQALEVSAMEGRKITHPYFSPDEWMQVAQDGNIVFEDGVRVSVEQFLKYRQWDAWQVGWSIYE